MLQIVVLAVLLQEAHQVHIAHPVDDEVPVHHRVIVAILVLLGADVGNAHQAVGEHVVPVVVIAGGGIHMQHIAAEDRHQGVAGCAGSRGQIHIGVDGGADLRGLKGHGIQGIQVGTHAALIQGGGIEETVLAHGGGAEFDAQALVAELGVFGKLCHPELAHPHVAVLVADDGLQGIFLLKDPDLTACGFALIQIRNGGDDTLAQAVGRYPTGCIDGCNGGIRAGPGDGPVGGVPGPDGGFQG